MVYVIYQKINKTAHKTISNNHRQKMQQDKNQIQINWGGCGFVLYVGTANYWISINNRVNYKTA